MGRFIGCLAALTVLACRDGARPTLAVEVPDAASISAPVSREVRPAACAGLGEAEVESSPFDRVDDIVDVHLVEAATPGGTQVHGARIRFHETSGMTVDGLQRWIDCHLTRDVARGGHFPDTEECPLALPGARAVVTAVPHGLLVEILSDDPWAGEEIGRRALALGR